MTPLPHARLGDRVAGGIQESRHRPEATLRYQIVAEHYPAFRERRAAVGRALPRYVASEFEAYLKPAHPSRAPPEPSRPI